MPLPKNTPWNNGHCHTQKAVGIRARWRKEREKKAAQTQPKEVK